MIELPLRAREALSPELALVDPELARLARPRLYDPGAFIPVSSPASIAPPLRPPSPVVATVVEPGPPPAGTRNRRRVAILGVVALVGVGGVLGWSLAREDTLPQRVSPAAAPKPAVGTPLTKGAEKKAAGKKEAGKKKAAPPAASATPKAAIQTFAWAPAPRAGRYELQLFRGADQILVERTTAPRLSVGPTWRFAGRTFRFRAGTYRWYVWALDADGAQVGKPLVQARLTIEP